MASFGQSLSVRFQGFWEKIIKHSIPEVLIKECLKYFDQHFTFKWRGGQLKELLSEKNGIFTFVTVVFNQDLTIEIFIAPNGNDADYKNQIELGIKKVTMANNIDHIIMGFELQCFQNENIGPIYNYKQHHSDQLRYIQKRILFII